jgi:hypothetical protein
VLFDPPEPPPSEDDAQPKKPTAASETAIERDLEYFMHESNNDVKPNEKAILLGVRGPEAPLLLRQ